MEAKKAKVVIFRDTFKWNPETYENDSYSAAEQLEEFLNGPLFLDKEIVSINYSVTYEGYNGAGFLQYCNHILLTYKG